MDFRGRTENFLSRLRRQATVICTMYSLILRGLVHEGIVDPKSGGPADLFAPSIVCSGLFCSLELKENRKEEL